jgi:bifunctional N-acetylglucosamine-1-phosphate-uridyltransferase/glucosamine-1-phosphate-acetyltransferase GlmU-like protein
MSAPGTITCNYDGAAKHRTEIGKNAFMAPTRRWSRR